MDLKHPGEKGDHENCCSIEGTAWSSAGTALKQHYLSYRGSGLHFRLRAKIRAKLSNFARKKSDF